MDVDSDAAMAMGLQLESGEPAGLVLKNAEAPPPPPRSEEPPVKKRKSKKETTPAAASEAQAADEIKKCTGFCGKKRHLQSSTKIKLNAGTAVIRSGPFGGTQTNRNAKKRCLSCKNQTRRCTRISSGALSESASNAGRRKRR